MRGIWKYAFVVLALCHVLNAGAQNTYANRLLCKMAEALSVREVLDTLPDGEYKELFQHNHFPLSVRIVDGMVRHIGYEVFDGRYRRAIPSPVYDFLERYSLQVELRLKPFSASEQMVRDQVRVSSGKLSSLPIYRNDSTLTLQTTNVDERFYVVCWLRKGKEVCKVEFPANYELLLGSEKSELVDNFSQAIATPSVPYAYEPPDTNRLVKEDPDLADYYVYEGGYNVIEQMSVRQYFVAEGEGQNRRFSPLFSIDYPVESVRNLIGMTCIDNEFVADVKYRKRWNVKDSIQLPFSQLMAFFQKEKCKAYTGVMSYNPTRQQLVMYVQMRNHEYAYEHQMRMTFDLATLKERKGVVKVRINGLYVPTYNIRSRRGDDV